MICSDSQGEDIKQRTLDCLRRNAIDGDCQLDLEVARKGVIAVCPMWNWVLNGKRCAGSHIMEAVKEFLELEMLEADGASQGLYVDRRTGEVTKVAHNLAQQLKTQGKNCKEFSGFQLVHGGLGRGWTVEVNLTGPVMREEVVENADEEAGGTTPS